MSPLRRRCVCISSPGDLESSENHLPSAENGYMATTARNNSTPKGGHQKNTPRAAARSRRATMSDAADRVARKKIGTLNVAAFMAYHRKNFASMKYWETKE